MLKNSLPVDFGGNSLINSNSQRLSHNLFNLRPSLAKEPLVSYFFPKKRIIPSSMKILPGPVSKADNCKVVSAGIMVILAIPPILIAIVSNWLSYKNSLSKTGTKGAPCPPRAISADLKSPIEHI